MTVVTKRNVTFSVVTSDSEINLGMHLFAVSCVLITGILLDTKRWAWDVVDELSISGPNYSLVAWCLFASFLYILCLLLAVAQLDVVILRNGLPRLSRRQEFGYVLVT